MVIMDWGGRGRKAYKAVVAEGQIFHSLEQHMKCIGSLVNIKGITVYAFKDFLKSFYLA